jgi:hypothetical protein
MEGILANSIRGMGIFTFPIKPVISKLNSKGFTSKELT